MHFKSVEFSFGGRHNNPISNVKQQQEKITYDAQMGLKTEKEILMTMRLDSPFKKG